MREVDAAVGGKNDSAQQNGACDGRIKRHWPSDGSGACQGRCTRSGSLRPFRAGSGISRPEIEANGGLANAISGDLGTPNGAELLAKQVAQSSVIDWMCLCSTPESARRHASRNMR